MKSKHISKDYHIDVWQINEFTHKQLLVPDFSVYLFQPSNGKVKIKGDFLDDTLKHRNWLIVPPVNKAFSIELENDASFFIARVNAWLYLQTYGELPVYRYIPATNALTSQSIQRDLSKIGDENIDSSTIDTVQKQLEERSKEPHYSQRQINRYLKKWLGLNISSYNQINDISNFVKANCGYPIKPETLVNSIDYQKHHDYSHFANKFRRLTGMSVKEYVSTNGEVQSIFW